VYRDISFLEHLQDAGMGNAPGEATTERKADSARRVHLALPGYAFG
jgi:hypothetical protein